MKKVFKNVIEAGQQKTNDPRLIEEIVKDFLEHSHSPFAVAFRQQQARQQATRSEGLHPNTMTDVNLKTMLRQDTVVKLGKDYQGVLRRDVECDEFLYDEHYTFIENAPTVGKKANPQVFNGKYVTCTQQQDGSYRPNLKPVTFTDVTNIVSYATAVGNELLWALEGLVGKSYTKVPNL